MFIYSRRVRFSDVDAAGILYYPRFLDLCHEAFEELFNEKSSWAYAFLINARKVGFPTVNIKCDYFKPLLFGDVAQVHLAIKSMGKSSLSCSYKIFANDDSFCYFEAQIIQVCMDIAQKKSLAIPADIRDFFTCYTQ